jgi:hypothetical protein
MGLHANAGDIGIGTGAIPSGFTSLSHDVPSIPSYRTFCSVVTQDNAENVVENG